LEPTEPADDSADSDGAGDDGAGDDGAGADDNGDDSGDDGAGGQVNTAVTRPDWLGTRPLPTTDDGNVVPQTTPEELVDRRFITVDTLSPPSGDTYESTVEPLDGEPLARSTWQEDCPVTIDELRYLTMSFWGFDGRPHTGEMIVNASIADEVVGVFEQLFEARYPIEEMRIATRDDLDAPPTGDGNMTTSFVCRDVVGGNEFSQHAFGLAVDINPFQNPYIKGDVVLPELATSYTDRSVVKPGMHVEEGPAVAAFDEIGWGWGGRWRTLKDFQHFSLNNR
jgi:hypothetical protein